ncbi:hypothetical protein [Microbispora sp. NPDC049633]|uniref:hypothetical protein n=1 Tax=Microbispora sp. NPDC049633 TaxID=3154355 RepID=UPI0034391FE3
MSVPTSRQRTTYQLVEAVVARLDQDELPQLPRLWDAYTRHPDGRERDREHLLGSGVLTEISAWAPIVVAFVGGAVLDALKEEITERSRDGIRTLFVWRRRRRQAMREVLAEPLPPFDDVEQARIARSVRSKALALGLPEDKAQLLADAVSGELLRESATPPPEG